MLLFASIQCLDAASAREMAGEFAGMGFAGIGLGGMVPRLSDVESVVKIVRAVREEISSLPLHVFGVGKPETVERIFSAGASSYDLLSYVRLAASGRLWARPEFTLEVPSPIERMQLALANLAAAFRTQLPENFPLIHPRIR